MYAVTSRDAGPVPRQPSANAAVAAIAATQAISVAAAERLLRPIRKVIELRHAVRFRPDADFPRILERLVVPLERLLSVERHREMIALEVHPQGMPLVRRDLQVGALLLGPPAVDRVVDGDIVLER